MASMPAAGGEILAAYGPERPLNVTSRTISDAAAIIAAAVTAVEADLEAGRRYRS